MAKTTIEWTDWTINCFWGCTKGCPYCAARSIARRFGIRIGRKRGYSLEVIERMARFKPVFLADQLDTIAKIKKPSRIFLSFMGEPFEFPDECLKMAFDTMRKYSQHAFLMLTKRPNLLSDWSPFPENTYIGVSATDSAMFTRAWTGQKDVKAAVKFVSFEPLLSWDMSVEDTKWTLETAGISWIILGQCTPVSPKTAPKIEWVKGIVTAADKAGIPVFLKNNLFALVNHGSEEMDFAFNKAGGYRQEFPVRQERAEA
jgi:protein gp37